MSKLFGTLAELARMRSGDEPIVSLYLGVRVLDEKRHDEIRLFVHDRVRRVLAQYPEGSPGREGLARTLARVQAYVKELFAGPREPGQSGLALFANEGLSLFRPLFFRRSFASELSTDHIPHLSQLARLAEEEEPALVVVTDSSGADIYQVLLGDLAGEESLHGVVPRRDGDEWNPGAARPGRQFERLEKDVRHAEAFVQRTRRRAVEEVLSQFQREPRSRLVLVGTAENLAAFERELPERLRAAVIARVPRPRAWESGDGPRRDGVLKGAAAALLAHERTVEVRVVDSVVAKSLRGGLAVLGPEDVVMALNEGRVHRLVLEEDFARVGWRCTHCDALGSKVSGAEACPYCGGALSAVGHLGEALVARTLGEGGEVQIVAHTNKLHGYRSVGAFLRQVSPAGQNPPGEAPG